jgi:hypothetical protein
MSEASIASILSPELKAYIVVLIICALLAYAMTEYLSKPVLKYLRKGKVEDPLWWTVGMRMSPVVWGGLCGVPLAGSDMSLVYACAIGAIGGLFAIPIYHKVTNKIDASDFHAVKNRLDTIEKNGEGGATHDREG